ncbi:MAG: alpha/beta fold hydrolase [Gemmatimonadaceae bacterium]
MSDADLLRVPVGPGALHVERYGYGGEPVILLHGFATCAFLWRHVGPRLAVNGCSAFAVDLLGYGESDRPPDAAYGIADQVDYVAHAMTALRVARAAVVGVDVGALVALRLASQLADRVAALVMIGPNWIEDVPGADVRELQNEAAKLALRGAAGTFAAQPLVGRLLLSSVAMPDMMPMRLAARYLAPYVGGDGAAQLMTLAQSLTDDDTSGIELGAIGTPTLVLRGTLDHWCEFATIERYASQLPNARALEIRAAGRLVPEEAPRALCNEMLEFLRGAEAGSERDRAGHSALEDPGTNRPSAA